MILKSVTLTSIAALKVAKMFYLSPCSLNFFHSPWSLPHPPHHLGARERLQVLMMVLANALRQSVTTGIWARVRAIHAALGVGTMCTASVMGLTEPKTRASAPQPSITAVNSKEQEQLVAAANKAQKAQASGTHQLK